MQNMKAVRIRNYGGPEVLKFEDAPRLQPGAGDSRTNSSHQRCLR
jgi:hypothetical protein